ncbi:hypothetical protein DER46DRAFT_667018 [Fusarium sp. MPI-SDFR-AT-0072]|uniref:Uncharacterized protein n=1 Tax=Fusarium oxysporum f. sp. rapae TaxID=485398 RepID=A0A8J5NZC7_FUSOX|nr:hypothetical protein Forpe1208_v010036 [Fusarium oxysporum f. sp. rapae]KAH7145064.1 hypothetical protein DER46DRAFT_667018 [Fusarium sp. MPI-SDFR-AT-0072]
MVALRAAGKQKENTQPLCVPSNDYATSYRSNWFTPDNGILDAQDLELLQHINCSYFSSGRPPTLLALKQHAQSLTNIIRKLAPSTTTRPVGTGDVDSKRWIFQKNEAFDWLNDLNTPYENDDPLHHDPLFALHNVVKSESEVHGIEHCCPLTQVEDFGPSAKEGDIRRPYMTHHDLIMHANECLEIIDHEYSSTGGLMSILPTGFEDPEDKKKNHPMRESQLEAARNCLLGQWILHHQHLVGRIHELEINYANATDVLKGEALVPQQMLSRAGADGVSGGREIVYPQDKYILVNCGEDIRSYIHRLIDVAEAQIEQKEKIWKASGVIGERIWNEERGGKVYAKGIVPIDLLTRFYRIKGKGHQSPLFVIPAAEQHPGVKSTRLMEERPTVVSIVTPTWPERVSAIEAKNKERLERADKLVSENQFLVREMAELKDRLAVQNSEIKRMTDQLAWYEEHAELVRKEPQD